MKRLRHFATHRSMLCGGLFLLLLMVLTASLAPLLVNDDYNAMNLAEQLHGPSSEHWLGQDQNGADMLGNLLMGTRLSLYVGIIAVTCSMFIGTIIGAISGYYGGWIDQLIMRIVDIFLAFPGILLAIALAAVLGPGINNLIISLSAVSWVTYARLIRGQFLSLKEQDFVTAARSMGASDRRIIFRHILPLCLSPLLVKSSFSLAGAILTEASLSFLGLGAPPQIASWGRMLSNGTRYLSEAWHLATFPGIAIMLTVLALNFIGDGLRDFLDVKDTTHKEP
jgi:peptide/nickel transport system permease protein